MTGAGPRTPITARVRFFILQRSSASRHWCRSYFHRSRLPSSQRQFRWARLKDGSRQRRALRYPNVNGWTATLRWRYFGAKPLVEDNSVRGNASSFVTARLAYEIIGGLQLGHDVFNLFDQEANDIDYFYASRLPDEHSAGVEDIHFHPLQSRSARFFLHWRP